MNFIKKIWPTINYSILQGFYWGSFSAIVAFASVYLLSKGFTNSQVGLVVAVGGILSVFLQPLVGSYADKSEGVVIHRLIVMISLAMIALCLLLLFFGNSGYMVATFYGLLVALVQVITPLIYSLCIFYIDRGVNIDFGVGRGIGSLAYAAVASILGILIKDYGADIITYVIAVFYVLIIVFTLKFHFEGVDEIKTSTDNSKNPNPSIFEFFIENKRFMIFLFGNIFVFFSHNAVSSYMYQVVTHHGYTSSEMGFAVSLGAMMELPALFLLNYINKKIKSGVLYKISVVFIVLKNYAIYVANTIGMIYFAMGFHLLGYGIFAGISIYYVNHIVDDSHEVLGQSLMTTVVTIGSVMGNLLGGRILDMAGVPAMVFVSCVVGTFGVLIVCLTGEKGKYNNA